MAGRANAGTADRARTLSDTIMRLLIVTHSPLQTIAQQEARWQETWRCCRTLESCRTVRSMPSADNCSERNRSRLRRKHSPGRPHRTRRTECRHRYWGVSWIQAPSGRKTTRRARLPWHESAVQPWKRSQLQRRTRLGEAIVMGAQVSLSPYTVKSNQRYHGNAEGSYHPQPEGTERLKTAWAAARSSFQDLGGRKARTPTGRRKRQQTVRSTAKAT